MSGRQRFRIIIEGDDKGAQAVIAKVNRAIGGMGKPVGQTQAGLKRLADSPALDSISKSMTGIGREAQSAVAAVGRLIPSLGTLAAIGTGAGMIGLVASWNNQAVAIGNTVRAVGISAERLQTWRHVLAAAGKDALVADSAFDSLAGNLQDAWAKRNPELLGLMTQLGIGMKLTAEGAVDVEAGLLDVMTAMERTRRGGAVTIGGLQYSGLEGAKNIARAFGLEGLIDVLLLGEERIAKLQADYSRFGVPVTDADVAIAQDFTSAMNNLGAAVAGAGTAFSRVLSPAITGAMNEAAKWIAQFHNIDLAIDLLPKILKDEKARTRALQGAGAVVGMAADSVAGMAGDAWNEFWADSYIGQALGFKSKSAGTPYSVRSTGIGSGRDLLDLAGDRDALLDAARRNPIVTPTMADIQHAGKVSVDVRIQGGPPGTVASVTQSGAVDASARVENSMAGLGP